MPRFKINKSELVKGLNAVAPAIIVNPKNPLMTNVLLEVKTEYLVLLGTNGDSSIRHFIPCNDDTGYICIEDGKIAVPGVYFTETIKTANKEELEIFDDGNSCRIKTGRGGMKLNCVDADKFPNISFEVPDVKLTMKKGDLSKAIDKTAFAVSNQFSRPVLTGVNLAIENNEMVMTATDSYRLSKVKIPVECDSKISITIPSKSLQVPKKVMLSDANEDVTISLDSYSAMFSDGNTTVKTTLLSGQYPETNRLIPQVYNHVLSFDKKEMISMLNRGMFLKNDGYSIFKLHLSEEECIISSRNNEVGEFKDALEKVNFEGKTLDISVNGKYILDALKAFDGDTILCKFVGVMKPFIFIEPKNDSVLELTLPVKTYQ